MQEEVLTFLQNKVNQKNIPGAVIQVTHKGDILLKEAVGWRIDYEEEQELMELDTVFDLASLTKVVATLPAILKLVDEGKLSLGESVSRFLPDFGKDGKNEITILNLLTHTSGLTSHRKFYKENLTKYEIFKAIDEETLEYPTGSKVVYSDLGFVLLSRIVENVTNKSFDEFVTEEIFKPLEMNETSFLPEFSKERFAATEYDDELKTYKIGKVHDNNANALGGVSGHAGLFSTVSDLSHYTSMIENGGLFNGKQILSSPSVERSKSHFTVSMNEARGLGWQLNSGSKTSCGDYFSIASFGHTGFTGTSIWFDPTIDLNVILLTNRVHYGREDYIQQIRLRLHNIIRKHF